MAGELNYELIAIKLGEYLKLESSVREIEMYAKATLKIERSHVAHKDITSQRAQTVYDWVMSLASSSISGEEKKRRLIEFVKVVIPDQSKKVRQEMLELIGVEQFVSKNIPDLERIMDDATLADVLRQRWDEIQKCMESKAFLAAIVLMGSVIEGVLLAVIQKNPEKANKAKSSPKDESGKVKAFHQWTLSELIAVSHECAWIQSDVKDFSNVLRDYRNMVHPWHQRARNFSPDEDTATICWEVVNAALNDLKEQISNINKAVSS